MSTRQLRIGNERGMSLVELMIALVVLAVGLLAVGRMFPTGARSQEQDRLITSANYFAQEKLETLTGRTWSDPLLTDGRHPAGTAVETLEQGQWTRFYQVTTMTGKLDNLKKVDVTVNYKGAGRASRSVTATTYVRR
jgi:prepilin-type N-terminal cleavage/methylation domain-containing protein